MHPGWVQLKRQLSDDEVALQFKLRDALQFGEGVDFGESFNRNQYAFLLQLRPGDELWEYTTENPEEFCSFEEGLAQVREEKILRTLPTRIVEIWRATSAVGE